MVVQKRRSHQVNLEFVPQLKVSMHMRFTWKEILLCIIFIPLSAQFSVNLGQKMKEFSDKPPFELG
jgi:hypothetical protein